MGALNKLSKVFFCLVLALCFSGTSWANDTLPDPEDYLPSADDIISRKKSYDDPTDLLETFHPKDILPPELWEKITFDVTEMQKSTKEILGFSSEDLVGKISPEIKPGKYVYQDVEKSPELKCLFPPVFAKSIKVGGPPFVCRIMDFEIEPTRQLHWSQTLCDLTKKNLGNAKLDDKGYLVSESWKGGIPFPNPGGKFKAQQVYYNMEKVSRYFDNCYYMTGEGLSFDKNLKMDKYNKYAQTRVKLKGRTLISPNGWLDNQAEKNGEFQATAVEIFQPRANRGLVTLLMQYDDPYKLDVSLMYLPQIRRIRKMSTTASQDPNGDSAYDDRNFLSQKISPVKFPYGFKIIEEREYLLAISYNKAKVWVDSKNNYAVRDIGFQRRPTYVLEMIQQDPNYIYSKRIYYIDKETFVPIWGEFYDQKGRLYREYAVSNCFLPEVGQLVSYGTVGWQIDNIDTHSSYQILTVIPATFSRKHFNIENLTKKGK